MALTCPRCGTEIPAEALYCSYCSLPRPKYRLAEAQDRTPGRIDRAHPSVSPHRPTSELNKPARTSASRPSKPARRSTSRAGKPPRRLRLPVLVGACLVAVISVGTYIFVVPLVYSERAEPKIVLSALDKLRRMPSNDPQFTLDARLLRELETSRRVGNLVSYQGWTVRPIKGTKTKVILAFSYEEVGQAHQSAEWIADLNNNTFTPNTELAWTISPPGGQEAASGAAPEAH
jgi:hypothetical protein